MRPQELCEPRDIHGADSRQGGQIIDAPSRSQRQILLKLESIRAQERLGRLGRAWR
ncbi:MAG TPA: hypothetical protein VE782_04270 [Myxococcaceae bacterium]|nr:hypothetical protein [Myxococcaceae bacterium]